MNDKKRRETQAALSAAIHTLLEAIPPAAFGAFHPEGPDEAKPNSIDDVRLLLAGEMMASAYLLLEKKVAPRDVLLNTWDLIATMTEVVSVEQLSELFPDGKKKTVRIPDSRKAAPKKSRAKAASAKA